MSRRLDNGARQDIADLLGSYCFLVDSGDGEGWAALFTEDGIFEVPGAIRLQGPAQLRAMPGTVAGRGKGKWRHQITNVVTQAGGDPDAAEARAYGLLTDWGRFGAPAAFSDYRVKFRRVDGAWKIEHLVAEQVGDALPADP